MGGTCRVGQACPTISCATLVVLPKLDVEEAARETQAQPDWVGMPNNSRAFMVVPQLTVNGAVFVETKAQLEARKLANLVRGN